MAKSDHVTVVDADFFDALLASHDDPPTPNPAFAAAAHRNRDLITRGDEPDGR
jgi:hypothetical protein